MAGLLPSTSSTCIVSRLTANKAKLADWKLWSDSFTPPVMRRKPRQMCDSTGYYRIWRRQEPVKVRNSSVGRTRQGTQPHSFQTVRVLWVGAKAVPRKPWAAPSTVSVQNSRTCTPEMPSIHPIVTFLRRGSVSLLFLEGQVAPWVQKNRVSVPNFIARISG
jgi:hypothetical protein